jgi:hypothetical protein
LTRKWVIRYGKDADKSARFPATYLLRDAQQVKGIYLFAAASRFVLTSAAAS